MARVSKKDESVGGYAPDELAYMREGAEPEDKQMVDEKFDPTEPAKDDEVSE